MIFYLLFTTICMGLVLLFYHIVLANERMYQINRWYLVVGLAFSLLVPFLPMGIIDYPLNLASNNEPSIVNKGLSVTITESTQEVSVGTIEGSSNILAIDRGILFLFYFYGVVALIMIMRLGWQFYLIRKKEKINPASYFKGHKIVLLKEAIVPYTFGKTIFVNKQQYDLGEISKEMMLHELTHARENHTLDIIFIEILKAIFWFNPVLYYYKRAIQMNHEFIADQNAISIETDIASYQNTLLSLSKCNPAGSLGTSLNFNVTKKRFQMMTASTSTHRYILKSALILPFFAILGLTFGCEPVSLEKDTQPQKVNIEILEGETVILNGETIPLSHFASTFSDLLIDPNQVIVYLVIQDEASMGTVTDVQEILRENGTLKINYSTTR